MLNQSNAKSINLKKIEPKDIFSCLAKCSPSDVELTVIYTSFQCKDSSFTSFDECTPFVRNEKFTMILIYRPLAFLVRACNYVKILKRVLHDKINVASIIVSQE